MKNLMKTLAVLVVVLVATSACDQSTLDDINPRNKTENPGNPNNDGDGSNNGNSGDNKDDGNSGNSGDNNNGGSNGSGNSNDLHAGVPVISGLSLMNTSECNGGLKKVYRNSSDNYNQTIENYKDALEDAGFTRINDTNGGGWGSYGGRQAWGYKGNKYVKINAQVQQNSGSVVYVCAWNGRPSNDNCDEDCND